MYPCAGVLVNTGLEALTGGLDVVTGDLVGSTADLEVVTAVLETAGVPLLSLMDCLFLADSNMTEEKVFFSDLTDTGVG